MKRITTLYSFCILCAVSSGTGANAPVTPSTPLAAAKNVQAVSVENLLHQFKTVRFTHEQFEVGEKLVALTDKSVLPEMERLLKAENRKVRMNAGYVLAKLDDERGFFTVLSELTDRSYRPVNEDEVRGDDRSQDSRIVSDHYYAAHVLWKIGDKRAVPALIEELKNPDLDYQAAGVLGRLGDKRAVGPLKELLTKIKAGFRPKHGDTVRECIAYGLMWLGEEDGFQMVIEQLKSPLHYSRRRNAALYLGEYGDRRAVPYLIQALQDKEPAVRRDAAVALGRLGDPAALSALRALAAGPTALTDATLDVATKAIKALEARAYCVLLFRTFPNFFT